MGLSVISCNIVVVGQRKKHIFLVITPPVDARGSGSGLSGLPILNMVRDIVSKR